jgi:hypothetical protein
MYQATPINTSVVAPRPSGAASAMRRSTGFSVPQRNNMGSAYTSTSTSATATATAAALGKKVTAAEAPTTRDYRVLYTARSNKKRKVFDDGVLGLIGKKAILMDLEGRKATFTIY